MASELDRTALDFDRNIRPLLNGIEAESKVIEFRANSILVDVGRLPGRPSWETKAETAMEDAEVRLWHALQALRKAREVYRETETVKV